MNITRIFREQPLPYFLLLLPLFFVFHGYVEYYDLVLLKDVVFLLIQYITGALILWILFSFLFRSWQKSALFTFVLLCFQFFFGSLHDTAKTLSGNSFLIKYSFILPVSLALGLVGFTILKKSKRRHNKISRYLTILLIVLIAADILTLIFKLNGHSKNEETSFNTSFTHCDTCSKPDIYFIVADEYAGHEQLNTLLKLDNTPFENELKKRGFHLVNNSRSNYNSTPFSIASMTNMDYLENIKGDDDHKDDIILCYEKINRNRVASFFKEAGYRVINNSIFNFADQHSKNLIRFLPTNERLLSAGTFFSRIQRDLLFHLLIAFNIDLKKKAPYYDVQINNNKNFERLWNEVSKKEQAPRFIYTHLMMPHAPYYFDKNGHPLPPETYKENEFGKEKEYVDYLQYCNQRFLTVIDHILNKSKAPPVIIFISDHGFRFYDKTKDPKFQFMNINAIYLPEKQYSSFYEGLSNVNQFRVLLNALFEQKLPLLKDSTIYIQ